MTPKQLLEKYNAGERNFQGANLEGANLKGANLNSAYLEGANLNSAYLEGASLKGAYLGGAYLEGAIGLYIFNQEGGRTCYAVTHGKSLMIQAGCFWGSLEEFAVKSSKVYKDDVSKNYAAQIAYLRALEAQL